MSSGGDGRGHGPPEDEKGEDEMAPAAENVGASRLQESVRAMASHLLSNAQGGTAGQPSALDALRLLRGHDTGLLGGGATTNNALPTIDSVSSSLNPLLVGFQAPAPSPIGNTAVNSASARLLLLLRNHQQNQQQQQQQQLSQLLQLGQFQLQQQQQQQASAELHAQLALRSIASLNALAGAAAGGGGMGGAGGLNLQHLSNLLGGNISTIASLPQAQPPPAAAVGLPASLVNAPLNNVTSPLGGGGNSSASPLGGGLGGGVNSSAVARMPEAQAAPAGEQPEMGDGEYFELFGFNDEDGVQIINETFPHKLYRMLFEVEKDGQEDIVSFFPHGKAFIVHQPKRFVDEIMPKYFSTTRMSSFQRQLNLYGFQRIDDGPEKGGFVHQYFQKGQRSLCNKIRRQRTRSAQASTPVAAAAAQPDNQARVGQENPQPMMNRGFAAVPSAAAAVPPPMSLPQNQQAQIVLQRMLNQREEENRHAGSNPPR